MFLCTFVLRSILSYTWMTRAWGPPGTTRFGSVRWKFLLFKPYPEVQSTRERSAWLQSTRERSAWLRSTWLQSAQYIFIFNLRHSTPPHSFFALNTLANLLNTRILAYYGSYPTPRRTNRRR